MHVQHDHIQNDQIQTDHDISNNHPIVRILKEASCPSLTGRSTLTYHVGCIDNAVQLRIFRNTGSGYFSQEWIPFERITDALDSVAALTSSTLKPIFTGKSVNTAGFVMAVLKDVGLITPTTGNQRSYQATDDDSFINEVQALIASGVSLVIEEPKKPAKKPLSSKKTETGTEMKGTEAAKDVSAVPSASATKKGTLKLKNRKQ